MSPPSLQGTAFSPSATNYTGYRTQYSNYSLPAMSVGPASAPLAGHVGPIMTNMHNPQGSMIMAGMPSQALPPGMMQPGYPVTSGQAAMMYGAQQHLPMNDRPFKCDQCPQSFNRNHDLKRHKRIHLAVKPFPCNHCDKSFSRKDALKVSCFSFPFLLKWDTNGDHRDIYLSKAVETLARSHQTTVIGMTRQSLKTKTIAPTTAI